MFLELTKKGKSAPEIRIVGLENHNSDHDSLISEDKGNLLRGRDNKTSHHGMKDNSASVNCDTLDVNNVDTFLMQVLAPEKERNHVKVETAFDAFQKMRIKQDAHISLIVIFLLNLTDAGFKLHSYIDLN